MIINISDHYTRVLQGSGADDGPSDGRRVLGALFGVQEGLTVDVLDSFELAYKKQGNDTVIDTEYITAKREQCECIAWGQNETWTKCFKRRSTCMALSHISNRLTRGLFVFSHSGLWLFWLFFHRWGFHSQNRCASIS